MTASLACAGQNGGLACSYRERGEKTTGAFADRLKELPLAMPQMCCSLYLQAAGHLRQVPIGLANASRGEIL